VIWSNSVVRKCFPRIRQLSRTFAFGKVTGYRGSRKERNLLIDGRSWFWKSDIGGLHIGDKLIKRINGGRRGLWQGFLGRSNLIGVFFVNEGLHGRNSFF
jgi:hypothetical protein